MHTNVEIKYGFNGKLLTTPIHIIVDLLIANRIVTENIKLGATTNGGVLILKRGGWCANKHNGGRSFAQFVTGVAGLHRRTGVDRNDYRASAFKTRKSRITPAKQVIATITPPPVQTKPRSVIDILKDRMTTGPVSAVVPVTAQTQQPVSKKRTLAQNAKAARKLLGSAPLSVPIFNAQAPVVVPPASTLELKIMFPDGTSIVGTPEAIAAYRKFASK